MIAEASITTSQEFYNLPAGQEVQIHTDADITIAFWFPTKADYGDELAVDAPGQFVGCGSNRARITGTAHVRIV